MMPKMDGFEICRCLREWSQTPIIMLSARGGEADKVKCLDLDADNYITKPFGANEQDDHISNVIDHRDVNEIAISVYTKDPDWESYFNRIENGIAWTHHLGNCEARFLDAESKGCWTY